MKTITLTQYQYDLLLDAMSDAKQTVQTENDFQKYDMYDELEQDVRAQG